MAVDEEKLRSTTNPMVWAEEFCEMLGNRVPDEGLMIGWFANYSATCLANEAAAIRRDERMKLADLFEQHGLTLFDFAADKEAMLGLLIHMLRLDNGPDGPEIALERWEP